MSFQVYNGSSVFYSVTAEVSELINHKDNVLKVFPQEPALLSTVPKCIIIEYVPFFLKQNNLEFLYHIG